jgi:hypothetical protein
LVENANEWKTQSLLRTGVRRTRRRIDATGTEQIHSFCHACENGWKREAREYQHTFTERYVYAVVIAEFVIDTRVRSAHSEKEREGSQGAVKERTVVDKPKTI